MDPDNDQLTAFVQEAVDATATAYTDNAGLDVEARVRSELTARGLDVDDDAWVAELAHNIRSGHHVVVSEEPEEPAE